MTAPVELLSAFFLDLAIGDPRWLPHPVQIMGRGITAAERVLRSLFGQRGEKAAGVMLVVLIVLPASAVAFALNRLLVSFSSPVLMVLGMVILIYLISTTLALRGLVGSVRLVVRAIERGDIPSARRHLSMIVGRDTDKLEEKAILRAATETLAENLSDGFVAPLFYLVVGGLPLAVAYKAVNTLDSMVGYKNERYLRFGWAAARLDDLANYIPARITGIAISAAAFVYYLIYGQTSGLKNGASADLPHPGPPIIASPLILPLEGGERSRWGRNHWGGCVAFAAARDSFRIMLRDGRNHTSPNSGMPEAAMAGALGIRLGGTSTYGGMVVEKPFIGDELQDDYLASAEQSLRLAAIASMLVVAAALTVLIVKDFL